jgi:alkanesulfonate monooxygenase SsuD/methylene tetrahydromethanopterin reductase-like flavin-dependent oxidoreductase (luciferase family)
MTGKSLTAGQLLRELAEEVCAADAADIDLVLVPEHHSGPPQTLSDPLTIVTWLLARTSTIKIGTGVLLLPLHSEVQVAEQAAILQQVSNGRLILGLGTGYQSADFEMFGADYSKRARHFEDRLTSLKRLFNEPVESSTLRPHLAPMTPPPIWIGAWSLAGLKRAATLADGWIADPARSISEIEEMASIFRINVAETNSCGDIVVMREGWVGATDDDARSEYLALVTPIFRYYLEHNALSESDGSPDLTELVIDRTVIGSPTTVANQIVDLVGRTGAHTVVLGLRHPAGPDHNQVMTCIKRLGEEVAPRVREQLSGKSVAQ